jgi:hypothetical protein
VTPRALEERPQAGGVGSPSLPSPRLLPVPLLLGRAGARGGTAEQSRHDGARSSLPGICAWTSPQLRPFSSRSAVKDLRSASSSSSALTYGGRRDPVEE